MDYLFITISIIVVIVTYFTCLWGFRAVVLILLLKLVMHLKDKGLEAFKAKTGGFFDADNGENPNL